MKLAIAGVVLLITNAICFLLMRRDKRLAQSGKRRISEKTLFISAACFGALGGTLAMHLFRHKTKHWQFKVFFPLLMVLQIILAALICLKWLL